MHQLGGPNNVAAVGLGNTLMTQTHPENRNTWPVFAHQFHRDARLVGRAGPRGNHYVRGRERIDVVERDLVVTVDRHALAQLPEILHQVVGERVVIVDHQEHV